MAQRHNLSEEENGSMEGPPLKVIAEKISVLEKQKIIDVAGNTKAGKERLKGKRISRIYTIGKRLVIRTGHLSVVIHFLMFGSYRLNERRENMAPRLSLFTDSAELNFYNCSVRILTNKEIAALDERSDVLHPQFAAEKVARAVGEDPGIISDILLDQDVFAGVGNIIKNEALYGAGIHPASTSKNIPPAKVKVLIKKTIAFSNAFYEAKKRDEPLKPILRVYRQKVCGQCNSKITVKRMGERQRMTYFCTECQRQY